MATNTTPSAPSGQGNHTTMEKAHAIIAANHANHDASHSQNPGVNAANVRPVQDQNPSRG